METGFMNRIIGLVLALVVGGLLVGGLLIPSIEGMTATEKTFENKGYYSMINTEEETILEWTPSVDPFSITVNGVSISLESLKGYGYSNYSIAFADDFILRYYYEGPNAQTLQFWNSDYVTGIASSSAYTATITINASGATFTTNAEGATTTSITHTGSYFVINDSGDHVMKLRDKDAYVKTDSTIVYAGGISGIATSTFAGFYFEGTIDNIVVEPMRNNITVSNLETHTSTIDGYINLVALEKVTFDTNYQPGDTPNERSQTYTYFLVPTQVTVELSQHMDATQIAMFGVISILGIMALVVVAANGIRNKY